MAIPNIYGDGVHNGLRIDDIFIECPYCGEDNRFSYDIDNDDMTQPHITVCKNCKYEIKFIERRIISFLI